MSKRHRDSERTVSSPRRFQILYAADFTCAYCGARPGNDHMHVAHIYPHARGGSDDDRNLVASCDRCNLGCGTAVAVPASMTTGEVLSDGWRVWKRSGDWVLAFAAGDVYCPIVIEFRPAPPRTGPHGYWLGIVDARRDWISHMRRKSWVTREDMANLSGLLDFMRSLRRNGHDVEHTVELPDPPPGVTMFTDISARLLARMRGETP